jgi:DNA-binding transcriptional LysR family regulator
MPMNFDDVTAFNAVAETGSISAAGRRLGLAKSVISKRVKDLESRLGATLFKRSTRSVRLTDQGRTLYGHTRTILNRLDEAAASVAEREDELKGTIRMAAPVSFGTLHLGRLLWPFMQRHPGLEVAVDLDDRVVDLLGLGYDIGIRVGRLPDSSLIARRLADMRMHLCAAPAYLARHGTPKSPEDLPDHDCIGYAHLTAGQVWQFEPARGSRELRSVRVRGRFVANNGELMRDAAIAGLGIVMLPEFLVAQALRDKELVCLMPACRPVAGSVYALYPRDRQRSRKITALLDHLGGSLARQRSWLVPGTT